MELNKLEVKSYDKIIGFAGRARKPMVDWVTESIYTSEKSLTKEEFNKIVEQHHTICGSLTYTKRKLTYSSGRILYKHILKEVMY